MVDITDDENTYLNESFRRLNASGREISGKEFENCTFTDCNFSEAKFVKCKFYECSFINCNLSLISVKGCSFAAVSFEESKAVGVNWTQAAWPKIRLNSPFRFEKCILNSSSFHGLGVREIAMVECQAKEVDFRRADCSEANFTHTDFADSSFGNTNLSRADFSEAINYDIDVFNNVVKKAKFSLPEAMNLLRHLDIELAE